MATDRTMIEALSKLLDTKQLNEWEEEFVYSLVERMESAGKGGLNLSEKQFDKLEEVYARHR